MSQTVNQFKLNEPQLPYSLRHAKNFPCDFLPSDTKEVVENESVV